MKIEPMLAMTDASKPIHSLVGTHVFDTKLDGVRMFLSWDGNELRLINRDGRVCNDSWPDLMYAPVTSGRELVLDGEVIAGAGFQDAARRNQATKARVAEALAKQMPATFVAFDILVDGYNDLRKMPYWSRRDRLDMLAQTWVGDRYVTSFVSERASLLDDIKAAGGEGVIAKRKTSLYVPGRSRNWLKYKLTNTVTCVGVGYERGHGSRSEFGAVRLAMVDTEGGVHLVGRVGSGFSVRDVALVKAVFDKATTGEDLPLIEVECLGLTREGVLRQPVYKGLRTDLTMHDANITQLEGLTRS